MGQVDRKMALILAEAKAKSGMGWPEIAEKSGVSNTCINGWLNGRHGATIETMAMVLNVLGLEIVIRKKGGRHDGQGAGEAAGGERAAGMEPGALGQEQGEQIQFPGVV